MKYILFIVWACIMSCENKQEILRAKNTSNLFTIIINPNSLRIVSEEWDKFLSDFTCVKGLQKDIENSNIKHEKPKTKKDVEVNIFHQWFYLKVVIVFFVVSFFGIFFCHFKQIAKLKRIIYLKEKELELEKENRRCSEAALTTSLKKIEEYEMTQRETSEKIELLKKENRDFRDYLFEKSGFLVRIQNTGIDLFQQKHLPTFKIKDFPDLKNCLNECYNKFVERLEIQFPQLSPEEINFCCLLKAKAKTRHLAKIIPMTPNAVSCKKRKVLKKIRLEQDFESLEEFLIQF